MIMKKLFFYLFPDLDIPLSEMSVDEQELLQKIINTFTIAVCMFIASVYYIALAFFL